LFDFGRRLLFGLAVSYHRLNALFHFTLELRERDDAVTDLRDHFVDDDGLSFLGSSCRGEKDAGRGDDQRSND
jgi:hypothetical protein